MMRINPNRLLPVLSLALLAPGLSAQVSEPDDAWLTDTRAQLALEEYSFEATSDSYCAPNRGQGLRSRVASNGLEVTPRANDGDSWVLHLRTVSVGRDDSTTPLGEGTPTACRERVELDHGVVLEWFENRPGGLEQGWTLERRLAGEGDLRIALEVSEAFALRVDADGRGGVLIHDSLDVELPYRGLVAFDATGRDLPAKLEATPSGILIRVDDHLAEYPLTIDPVLEYNGWAREGNLDHAFFGSAISGIGDVNGDGYDDFAIGAPGYDSGQASEGRVWVYHGSPNGPVGPVWIADGNQALGRYGDVIAAAGDVNGDGFDDMIVGAPFWDAGESDEGHIWVYAGSPTGIVSLALFRAESNQDFAGYGRAVAGLGDVNGDGYDDIAVGAPEYSAGQVSEGHVWVYHGSASGPVVPAAFRAESNQVSADYGLALAAAGDVNADGFADLIVGAPIYDDLLFDEGGIWVYHGSSNGLLPGAATRIAGGQDQALYGQSVAGIGDVDADGFDDVAVSAPFFSNGEAFEGQVWVYRGSPSGVTTPAAWRADGDQVSAYFGRDVAGAGDVNGDGFDDLIVGASGYDNGETDEGRASLYLGSPYGLIEDPAWMGESDQAEATYGHTVAGIGDMNGDGFDDVLVSAPLWENLHPYEGAVYLFEGTPRIGSAFCVTGLNSTGAAASIQALGSPSVTAGLLSVVAHDVPNTPGIFFHGSSQITVPFGNGIRCAGGAVTRGAPVVGSGNSATYAYDNSSPRRSLSDFVGMTRHFQFWFRDGAGGGAAFNTSSGVSVTIAP